MLSRSLREPPRPPEAITSTYPADLQPLVQGLLATLANLEVEYEHEIGKLAQSTMSPSLRGEVARRLEEGMRQRREPYLAALASLDERVRRRFLNAA